MSEWKREQSGRLVWSAGFASRHHISAIVETGRHTGISAFLVSADSDGVAIAECDGFASEETAMSWCETQFRLLRLESLAMLTWKRPAPP